MRMSAFGLARINIYHSAHSLHSCIWLWPCWWNYYGTSPCLSPPGIGNRKTVSRISWYSLARPESTVRISLLCSTSTFRQSVPCMPRNYRSFALAFECGRYQHLWNKWLRNSSCKNLPTNVVVWAVVISVTQQSNFSFFRQHGFNVNTR